MKKLIYCTAICLLGATVAFAAPPKRTASGSRKQPAAKTATSTSQRIPLIANDIIGGYFTVSKQTMPIKGEIWNYMVNYEPEKYTLLDSIGNPVSINVNGNVMRVTPDGYVFVSNFDNGDYIMRLDGTIVSPSVKNYYITYLGDHIFEKTKVTETKMFTTLQSLDGEVIFSDINYGIVGKIGDDKFILTKPTGNYNTKYGVANKKGDVIIPFNYDYLKDAGEGYLAAQKDNKVGILDLKGNVVIPFVYDFEEWWCEDGSDPLPVNVINGVATFESGEKWGAVDMNNNVIVPFKYSNAVMAYDGIYVQKEGDYTNYYVYSPAGAYLKKTTYVPEVVAENLYTFVQNQKTGCKDAQGNVVIQPVFDQIMKFTGPTTLAKQNNAWHIIDRSGKIIKKNVAKAHINEVTG